MHDEEVQGGGETHGQDQKAQEGHHPCQPNWKQCDVVVQYGGSQISDWDTWTLLLEHGDDSRVTKLTFQDSCDVLKFSNSSNIELELG